MANSRLKSKLTHIDEVQLAQKRVWEDFMRLRENLMFHLSVTERTVPWAIGIGLYDDPTGLLVVWPWDFQAKRAPAKVELKGKTILLRHLPRRKAFEAWDCPHNDHPEWVAYTETA